MNIDEELRNCVKLVIEPQRNIADPGASDTMIVRCKPDQAQLWCVIAVNREGDGVALRDFWYKSEAVDWACAQRSKHAEETGVVFAVEIDDR